MKELWKPVFGYEEFYEVSNLGRVRTVARIGYHPKNKHGKPHYFKVNQKIKSQNFDRYGYRQVGIRDKTLTVHRLVAMAFSREFYFPGAQVNHKNSNRADNRIENLEWVTGSENVLHSFSGKREKPIGEKNGASKLTARDVIQIRALLKQGIYQETIAKQFGVAQALISRIKLRKLWAHIAE